MDTIYASRTLPSWRFESCCPIRRRYSAIANSSRTRPKVFCTSVKLSSSKAHQLSSSHIRRYDMLCGTCLPTKSSNPEDLCRVPPNMLFSPDIIACISCASCRQGIILPRKDADLGSWASNFVPMRKHFPTNQDGSNAITIRTVVATTSLTRLVNPTMYPHLQSTKTQGNATYCAPCYDYHTLGRYILSVP